ncbi:hypothetical protein [Puia sp.]
MSLVFRGALLAALYLFFSYLVFRDCFRKGLSGVAYSDSLTVRR